MTTKDLTAIDETSRARDYGPPRLIVELTNICNLHCSYCVRDEDALYHTPARYFSIDLLRRLMTEVCDAVGLTHVVFTGGETTLHPNFEEVIEAVGNAGLKCSFVTNGWHFERVWPAIRKNREAVTHVAFSLDGATREAHDRWRGEGSFVRLVRAFSLCSRAELPFVVKTVIRKDTLPQLEQIALFAARMGASTTSFTHLLPTSSEAERELGLDADDRRAADQEVAMLSRIFKMRINLEVGYYNIDPAAPCSSLAVTSYNVDYLGRLTLCCNLSGYRGGADDSDIVADLNHEPFSIALDRLKALADLQNTRRREALAQSVAGNIQPDIILGSPCLFCLKTFRKAPWYSFDAPGRSLPIMKTDVA